MEDDNELKIEYRRVSGSRLTLVAKSGDQVLHNDKLDIASFKSRKQFVKELCKKCAGVEQHSVEQELVRIANEVEAKHSENLESAFDGNGESQPYRVTGNGVFWVRKGEHGPYEIRLTNFPAKIVTGVLKDDGAEVESFFEIETMLDEQTRTITVTASEFSAMNWPIKHLGPKAIIFPGMGLKDHARAAIQILSNPESRRIFTHTGWRKIGDEWLYLHGGGAIGAGGHIDGVEVSLPDELSNYHLPVPPAGPGLEIAIKASLSFLEIAPYPITMPLLAAAYRSVLGNCDFSIHLSGPTGEFKSELAALMQQHFGSRMVRLKLPAAWSGTANGLEGLAFAAKDSLFTIDDFVPSGTPNDIHRLHQKADRIFRGQANHSGRIRMRPDATLRPSKPPRGVILSTGEEKPRGLSCKARMLIVEVPPKSVEVPKLTRCQEDAKDGVYGQAMAGFIGWVSKRYGEIAQNLGTEMRSLRDHAAQSNIHRRTPEIVANLAIGLRYLLKFAQDSGALDSSKAKALWVKGWAILGEVAAQQARHHLDSEPTNRFLQLIASAIATGHAHLANKEGNAPANATAWGWRLVAVGPTYEKMEPHGVRIGWVDDEDVFLDKNASYKVAQQMASTGEGIRIDSKTLLQQMYDKGLIHREPKRETNIVRRTLQGQSRDVIFLVRGVLNAPEPDIPAIPEHNSTRS